MSSDRPPPPEAPHLAGRDAELRTLVESLLPARGSPRPVAISALGGMGKTALVAAFAMEQAERFPGGLLRLSALEVQADDRAFLASMAARLELTPSLDDRAEPVRKRLIDLRVLLHIDDVDTRAHALAVAALGRRLGGTALVVSGRFEALGAGLDGATIRLGPLSAEAALSFYMEEAGRVDEPTPDDRELVTALGRIPLALRLAGRLVRAGKAPAEVFAAVEGHKAESDEQPPSSGRRLLKVLTAEVERLEAALGEDPGLLAGWRALVHGPPSGLGKKLGAALTGLVETDFEKLAARGEALGLLSMSGAGRWQVQRLAAEVARHAEDGEGALARATEWFVARMGDPQAGWGEVREEMEALGWWLRVVPEAEWARVVQAGTEFAKSNGPFGVWAEFGERALAVTRDDEKRSVALWLLANVAHHKGDQERASVAAEEMREIAIRLDRPYDHAAAWTILADVHAARGQTREAARILQDEVLPRLKQHREAGERTVVLLKLTDLFEQDGYLDQAFELKKKLADNLQLPRQARDRGIALAGMGRIASRQRRLDEAVGLLEEAVVLLGQLGDVRGVAVSQMELADALVAMGETRRALSIYESQVLPVLRASADPSAVALVKSRIAAAMQDLGMWDDALRIATEEVLPILRKLEDDKTVAHELLRIGDIWSAKGDLGEAIRNYSEALAVFDARGNKEGLASALTCLTHALHASGLSPETWSTALDTVVTIHTQRGDRHALAITLARKAELLTQAEQYDEALHLYEDEITPALRAFADEKNLAAARGKMAHLLTLTGSPEVASRLLRDEVRPFFLRVQDEHGLAWVDSLIANTLDELGDGAECLRIYETDVLPVIKRTGKLSEQAAVLATIGVLRGKDGVGALKMAVALAVEAGDIHERLSTRVALGRSLRRRNEAGDSEEALSVLEQGASDARSIRSSREVALLRFIRAPILEKVAICGFKNIADLTLDLTRPSTLPGRWTCIAGINGAGKSAILQAIVLVLLGDERARDVGSALLERMRRRVGDTIQDAEIRAELRMGRDIYELALHLGERGVDRERLEKEPAYEQMRTVWQEREKDHLLLAYGPGRNLSEHLDGRHESKAEEVRRVMTLFDPLTQVASAEALIKGSEESKVVWRLLRRLLARVLEGSGLALDTDRSSLRFRSGATVVSPVDLPDGFRATIALLADICATWQKKAPDEAKNGDPSRIRGIVLVDEIDLHLHPTLQRSLVPNLRRALPEVQWIITTHSPLVLGSFDKNEIVALEADAEKGVRLREPLDRQILGFKVDEIYRWLMGVEEPRSTALAQVSPEDKSLLLAQSPTMSEAQARENLDYLDELLEGKGER